MVVEKPPCFVRSTDSSNSGFVYRARASYGLPVVLKSRCCSESSLARIHQWAGAEYMTGIFCGSTWYHMVDAFLAIILRCELYMAKIHRKYNGQNVRSIMFCIGINCWFEVIPSTKSNRSAAATAGRRQQERDRQRILRLRPPSTLVINRFI